MGHNKIVLATVKGSLELIKQSIENDEIETAIKLARYFKLKFEDRSDKNWWYRQWHSVMETVEHRLREGLVELAYQTLEQAGRIKRKRLYLTDKGKTIVQALLCLTDALEKVGEAITES